MTEAVTLGSVAKFAKGSGLSKSHLTPDGSDRCIHYGELFTQYGAVISEVRSRTNLRLPVVSRAGDVLMPTSDVTPRGLAKASAIQHSGIGLGGDVLVIRADPKRVDGRFLAYAIRNDENQVLSLVRGSTVFHLHAADMRSFSLYLPPVREQARIARVLEDSDDLVIALGRVIDKKQAMKQGMMQQLLTGKRRLPGFERPWIHTTLGEIARINTGSRNNQDKESSGRYPFFVRSATVERIDSYSYDCEAILVPGEGGIGSIFHYIDGPFEVHQRVYKISDFAANALGRFVFFYMQQFFGAHAMQNSVKATVDSLRLPTFKSFPLLLPAQVDEQRAIAAALRDADQEIGALTRRFEKAGDLKQGMMQELLTGRTQLPIEAAA